MTSDSVPTIGVLALQGAFAEHLTHLEKTSLPINYISVRTPEELSLCSGLIIPGGESTAIALGAARCGLLEPLREWVRNDMPTWGTCAGMIMLAREATGGKKQQELIGGWDGRVSRNGWGSQVDSFETPLDIPVLNDDNGTSSDRFPGVFIRAPVVERLLPSSEIHSAQPFTPVSSGRRAGEELNDIKLMQPANQRLFPNNVTIPAVTTPLASTTTSTATTPSLEPPSFFRSTSTTTPIPKALCLTVAPPLPNQSNRPKLEVIARLEDGVRPTKNLPGPDADVVALRQGNVFVTSFHPELTGDARLHAWWVRQCVLPNSRR